MGCGSTSEVNVATAICGKWGVKKRKTAASAIVPFLLGSSIPTSLTCKKRKLWLVASLNSRGLQFMHLIPREADHTGETEDKRIAGPRVRKRMLFWSSVNGLVKHGTNHQGTHGQRMERSQGLWKLLHGPHSYNSMVTWKTSWAKDYRLESEKLNHNGIYVTQDNVLLKQNKTVLGN